MKPKDNVPVNEANMVLINQFIDDLWLQHGLADNTLQSYRIDLSQFAIWLQSNQCKSLLHINKSTVLKYLAYRLDKKI
jgi:Site-specific recombinase XerD